MFDLITKKLVITCFVYDLIFLKIKEMSDLVNKLKEEKDQVEYKYEQCGNVIKCQKLEIESKASLVKQLELVSTFIHFITEFSMSSKLIKFQTFKLKIISRLKKHF